MSYPAVVSAPAGVGPFYTAAMSSGWPLIGRSEELAVIAETAVDPTAAGIVLSGAAGVGKTRLAREGVAHAAARGRMCRFVVATASGRSLPLGVFVDFADRIGADPLHRVRDVIDAITSAGGAGRVVVGIDDAHLLDDLSAVVVHQLVTRRLATVVLTVRIGECPSDAITALWKDELVPRLEVQPLSKAETSSLLERVLDGEVESSSAARLWNYTRGNVLYLRQLVADEQATGRLTRRFGLWTWVSRPQVSASLAELVETTVGRQPEAVIEVLDLLAVADPLELGVLTAVAEPQAVDEAERHGLITIDQEREPPLVRLGHPMFGEVRRTRATTGRLRHLRRAVATELGRLPDGSPQLCVRRGLLLLDADLTPDPADLCAAATEALRMFDADLADRFAVAAMRAGGGREAQLLHAVALVNSGRGTTAAAEYEALSVTAASDVERVACRLAAVVSIAMESDNLQPAEERLLSVRAAAAESGPARAYDAAAALLCALMGRAGDAVAAARRARARSGWLGGFEALLAAGSVIGLGDLGELDQLVLEAERGYEVTAGDYSVSAIRFMIGIWHIQGYRYGGMIDAANEVSERLAADATDFPKRRWLTKTMEGIAALASGSLTSAHRCLREAQVIFASRSIAVQGGGLVVWAAGLATALAMAGDSDSARRVLDGGVPLYPMCDTDMTLAEAWTRAADGALSEAIALARRAASREHQQGRPAREVVCLQTAAQFGDATVATRLTELTTLVQGPRVRAAAAHAVALQTRDGDGLLDAADRYAACGDRVAAADTAAQAALAFRSKGLRGAALTATTHSRHLAGETGADTPALRANDTRVPLTGRQREIIALAATGLTNRQIAERLTMSVRTVEGHLFRASQQTGVNSRAELIQLID